MFGNLDEAIWATVAVLIVVLVVAGCALFGLGFWCGRA